MGTIAKVTAGGATHLIASSAYGTCSTAAATVAKVATIQDSQAFTLIAGTTVHIYFTYSNTAASPTLNVNSTGALPIYKYGTTVPGNTAATSWAAGAIVSFTYNTTARSAGCWTMNDHIDDTDSNTNTWRGVSVNGTALLGTGTNTGSVNFKSGTNTTVSGSGNDITINATDTDTKVTSVGNHYAPAEDTTAVLSADASSSTAATWNSTSLVTGVNIKRDAKGHVVGVTVDSIKMPANPNSNNAVTQTATDTANANYRVLFSATADDTTRTEGARKDKDLTYNPSTGQLTIASQISVADIVLKPVVVSTWE